MLSHKHESGFFFLSFLALDPSVMDDVGVVVAADDDDDDDRDVVVVVVRSRKRGGWVQMHRKPDVDVRTYVRA